MTTVEKSEKDWRTAAERVLSYHVRSLEGWPPKKFRFCHAVLQRFLVFAEGRPIDEDRVLEWMARESAGVVPQFAATKFRLLRGFLKALAREGLVTGDPMGAVRARFGKNGSIKIALALRAPDRVTALKALQPDPAFAGFLGKEMLAYLDLKRSLGAKYRTEGQTLADFDRFLRREPVVGLAALTQEVMQRWIATMSCGPITLTHKVRLLARFFEHLAASGVIAQSPLQRLRLPRASTRFRPYIFRKEEVAALLDAAQRLCAYPRFPLRPETVHTVLALLYGLGLRLGEACRLQVDDVDLARSTLSINKTKFYKTRIAPFGPKLGSCLAQYLDLRRRAFPPLGPDDPLFVAFRRRPIGQGAIRRAFHTLLDGAGIGRSPGQGRPRLHDLRHTFAVHRLLRWYREGVDVQSRLPRLSTFMGHIDIHSTQVYLTVTADLLDQASTRFHAQCGSLFKEDPS